MMNNESAIFWFIQTALSFQNTPYRWGGDGPTGIDCSGLVVECLLSCGELPHGTDLTANDLWHRYRHAEVDEPNEGCLAFWLNPAGEAYHVAICLDPYVCLTADGGGSTTLTSQDATRRGAFVKIRPNDYRRPKPKFVNIFK